MSKNSKKTNNNVARRRFLGTAGAFLGVTGASSLLFSNSAEAAEKIPAKLFESLTAYAAKVGKDKRESSAIRKELDLLLKGLKNGEDLEKLCQTLVDGRKELSEIVKPYQGGGDYPSFIIIILVIIIIIASTSELK